MAHMCNGSHICQQLGTQMLWAAPCKLCRTQWLAHASGLPKNFVQSQVCSCTKICLRGAQ